MKMKIGGRITYFEWVWNAFRCYPRLCFRLSFVFADINDLLDFSSAGSLALFPNNTSEQISSDSSEKLLIEVKRITTHVIMMQ